MLIIVFLTFYVTVVWFSRPTEGKLKCNRQNHHM